MAVAPRHAMARTERTARFAPSNYRVAPAVSPSHAATYMRQQAPRCHPPRPARRVLRPPCRYGLPQTSHCPPPSSLFLLFSPAVACRPSARVSCRPPPPSSMRLPFPPGCLPWQAPPEGMPICPARRRRPPAAYIATIFPASQPSFLFCCRTLAPSPPAAVIASAYAIPRLPCSSPV